VLGGLQEPSRAVPNPHMCVVADELADEVVVKGGGTTVVLVIGGGTTDVTVELVIGGGTTVVSGAAQAALAKAAMRTLEECILVVAGLLICF
jgi:hypothetical protein